jgi:hypothetical protein
MFRRIFPAGAAGTWVAMMLRGDGPQERRSPLRPRGHPFGTGCPSVSVVQSQRNLDRGCTIDVLAALARPFQRDLGVLSRTSAVEFYPEIVGLCAPY